MTEMDNIKKHFEEEATQYDNLIKMLIPSYAQIVEAVVNTLPFEYTKDIEVLDLGCGTGTIAKAVKDKFPKARITCVDISPNMLQMAAIKLCNAADTTYISSDFYKYNFDKEYDAVVSSLALHHLVTEEDKLDFYRRIYSGIKAGGIFINADVVLASTDILQNRYMEQWKSFLYQSVPKEEVDNKWIRSYYEEDRPISLFKHIEMLKEVGFEVVDVVWKYYNFAVYMAAKGGAK